jgi:glycosyltransferase involved in cell wall biosynthesis
MAGSAVAFVLKGYPRLSETFIAHEIRALERSGLDIRIVSLRHPTDRHRHPVHGEIAAPVAYLPEYLYREPVRVWRGWRAARLLAGYGAALATWRRDLVRDPTPNRIRRFGQALVLASELPGDVGRLHAHFVHTPSSVARYAAIMRGLPWSGSAHAKDIWTTPDREISEKLGSCDWLVTCSEAAHQRLTDLAPDPAKVELVYHGLDPARFPATEPHSRARDGGDPDDPVVLLSVARAVEKKGLDVLIDALAALPASIHWRLIHIGGGGGLGKLRARAEAGGIAERIEWRGALPQDAVREAYREADLFVLPSRIAGDGDRDGLPNVLLEASSQSLACVASRVSGLPELIEHEISGVLVPPDDADALAAALARLIGEPLHRLRLGRAGAERVRTAFSFDRGIELLARRFGLPRAASADASCTSHSMHR